ncbi:hypothetical protein [Microbacterium thalli]|uniref:Multidrug transporter n=1 Tax=Microbacterium thalli TaxID=3027921 RepID=A0ABT5SJJ3_9MICO|nr:hypothetical protein [Microbacterium thalli]MDD7929521.1 hypothetical protein [Microbacterium thalli]MDD7962970.1 hypothetical protein [Microbacterium thalli]MDN8548536.1 hypothetical protein [Microbacterium thalli]
MSEQDPATDQEPLTEPEAVRKDMRYSPASDTETREKQDDADTSPDADVDDDLVRARPGTGGPDDVGDVEVAEEDLNLPWRDGDDAS